MIATSMAKVQNPAIPQGSWVLVTGISGFIASHLADKLLEAGYKVRGTTRDVKKSSWLTDLFDEKYGKGNFELFPVDDMAAEGAFDEAVKGKLFHVPTVTAGLHRLNRRCRHCARRLRHATRN